MSSPDPRPVRPNSRAAAALATALALLAACGGPPPQQKGAGAVPVTVGVVTREAVPVLLQAIGTVEAQRSVAVRPQVGGEVITVDFREGDDVARGQRLAAIDPRSYRAALERAQAQLARDQALAVNADQDIARYADLVAKDYVTRERYDGIVADAKALQATLAADRAAVEDARLDLERAVLRAPIAGRTGQVLIHAGNLVKANDDRALVVIQQIEPIDVSFAVPQAALGAIRARAADGLKVQATPPHGDPHHGTLTFIDNAVDPTTGTLTLKATFANRDRALWPGQFVTVVLTLSTDLDAIVAPAPAVQTGQDGDFVFVVKGDDTVESRPVTVARTVGERAVISRGLEGGERVVTDGQLRLVPGSRIEVKPAVGVAGGAAEGTAAESAGDPGAAS